jgi:hypothetical protein
MAGARRGSEPNFPSATYETTPGPSAMPPVMPSYPADQAMETATRRTVADVRAGQRSA